jgi:SAM-dependent methyltransferase
VIKSLVNRLRDSQDRRPSDGTAPPVDPYVLATGKTAEYRLRLLHDLYKAGTRRVLAEAGVRAGMRVADVGCGVGMVTEMLAGLVGSDGRVVGIDGSAAQIDEARTRLEWCASNTTLVVADALATGLPAESFDIVYCRFLLMHLPQPERALWEMRRLLRPSGVLVCEDGDVTTAGSETHSALNAFAELFERLGPLRRVDYSIGRRLFQLVREAGFLSPEISFNQPVVARGENKRLLELSVAEAAPAIIQAGLLTHRQMELTLAEMRSAGTDSTLVALMLRMTQVWARKDGRAATSRNANQV